MSYYSLFFKNILARFAIILGLFTLSATLALPAQAIVFNIPTIKDSRYSGKYVSQSIADPIEFKAGETKQVTVAIKNTGTIAWQSSGANYVSVYTVDPNYRSSEFYNKQWLGKNHPAKLEKVVKPQETATFKISLTAPLKTGEYTERFWLAAEDKTWIKGSGFYFKIKVIASTTDPVSPPATEPKNDPLPEAFKAGYKAEALLPAPTYIQSGRAEQSRITISFKNTGTATWQKYILKEVNTKLSRGTSGGSEGVSVADDSWAAPPKIVEGDSTVAPGEILQIEFTLQTPSNSGEYLTRFELSADNIALPGAVLDFPLLISGELLDSPPVPASATSVLTNSTRALITEPAIRVGLYTANEPVQFRAEFPYQIYTGTEFKGMLNPLELATLNYSAGTYSFKGGEIEFSSSDYLRLVPQDPTNYFTLVNYERTLSGRNKNFNMYRGTLEFKYSPKSAAPYVINELPLDEYVAGVAETSNGAPVEYNKALIVAERSYAYYHLSTRGSKDLFDVYPTTASQLYLGYNSELLMPQVVAQTQATHGEMVTFNGKPVVTPYYSRSDGRTRSWKEVWGGDAYPWLQSVEAVYDKGKTMLGHGVGMSGSDALKRAGNDGWTYEQILKHYYTGTQVERIY